MVTCGLKVGRLLGWREVEGGRSGSWRVRGAIKTNFVKMPQWNLIVYKQILLLKKSKFSILYDSQDLRRYLRRMPQIGAERLWRATRVYLFHQVGQPVEISLRCFYNPLDGAAVTAIGWELFSTHPPLLTRKQIFNLLSVLYLRLITNTILLIIYTSNLHCHFLYSRYRTEQIQDLEKPTSVADT